MLRKIFGPASVPPKFKRFPKEMAVRPWQLRASAAESALMIPAAHRLSSEYGNLRVPLVIAAGAEDKFIESEQSAKLHADTPQSTLRMVPGAGHMVHQTATREIMSAIDLAASASRAAVETAA
jgi:pimeloyl-ACP methyl ester carboxylesterase